MSANVSKCQQNHFSKLAPQPGIKLAIQHIIKSTKHYLCRYYGDKGLV